MRCGSAYLEKSILLLGLQLVGTEETETTCSLFDIKTLVVTLEELEHVVNDDSFKVDLFFVVEILCL